MALLRLFDPTTQFQTKSGALNVAGKLRVYAESTDDLANIYGDDLSLLSQPLILDSNGRARGLFVDSGRSYRLEVYDRNDSLLFTIRRLEPNASGTIVSQTVFIKGTPDEIDVEDSVTEKIRTYTVSLSAKVTGEIDKNRESIVKESEARKGADDELRKMIDSKNAFSNVKVGSTTVAADSKADTLELASSSAITLTPDAANDKVTIGVSTMGAASSSAAGTAGIVPAPGAGKQTSFLRGDGTWVVLPNTDTKQRIVASDSKTYLTGVTTTPTSSNQDLTGVANANVYATAGQLHATTFDVNSKCTLQFNTTTNALDFVFA